MLCFGGDQGFESREGNVALWVVVAFPFHPCDLSGVLGRGEGSVFTRNCCGQHACGDGRIRKQIYSARGEMCRQ